MDKFLNFKFAELRNVLIEKVGPFKLGNSNEQENSVEA
jgi:hypothetical protein